MTDASSGLMRKKQVAVYLDVSIRTIDSYMRQGILPFIKIAGRTVRFRASDLDAAMEKFRRR